MKRITASLLVCGLLVVGMAQGAEILVTSDITTSTTWTADNTYNLQTQIYVLPGATLTIEPGTIIASTPSANGAGSLAVCRGAKIYAVGTALKPIIFTSKNDDFKTWRPVCNEWGNLTIMGRAMISNTNILNQQSCPLGSNVSPMEGLVEEFPGDTRVLYGGNDDDDDSGSLMYVSIRYGGRVVGLANELNGLSLGGVGRETDIAYLEIMNNVDDGIEIWGGTVNLKYVSIWNVGDDYFDIDQGWRGKAQFGLIVQGYSADAAQGSGVCDHCFEMDGAENSDAQPVTTANIYNFTAIGQPLAGRAGTAWRGNARVQFHNSIFMDLGTNLVRFDNASDNDNGYAYNGTLTWAETWTTNYDEAWNKSNPKTGGHPNVSCATAADLQKMYQAQTSGKLAEINYCVFYNNNHSQAYSNSNGYNYVAGLSGSNCVGNIFATQSPIRALVRGADVTAGGKTLKPVVFIDPRAANDALTPAPAAPADGFFTPVTYRGAFSAYDNWLIGWTAAYQYGMTGLKGDVTGDDQVNLDDISVLSENWLLSL
ncbi:MAG: hypothetical protein WHS88_05995 [Anaerohalosphaeraceae bacterium]